jgi:NTE family protein
MITRTLQPLTLALAGGGAKCAAHAGVLDVLEELGLPVGALTGASAGGLVAVLYALGFSPAAIRDYIAETNLLEVWEFDPHRQGIFGGAKTHERLKEVLGERTFADLAMPVTVLAVDVSTGCEVRLNQGALEPAVSATLAVPGLFSPALIEGRRLVDGGLLNPLPVDVARELGGPVVAVDLLTGSLPPSQLPQLFEARGPLRYATEVARRLGLLDMLELVHQSALICTDRLVQYNLQLNPPAVLLRPAVAQVGLFAFDLAPQAFTAGRVAAEAASAELLAAAHGEAQAVAMA